MKKVIIYGTKGCPWCDKVRDLLDEHGIKKVVFHDVIENYSAREELISKTNQYNTPVTEIDNILITGFDKEKLEKAMI